MASGPPFNGPREPGMDSGPSSKGKERAVPEAEPQQTDPPADSQNGSAATVEEVTEILSGDADWDADDDEAASPLNKPESNESEVKRAYEMCGIKLGGWTIDQQRNEISVISYYHAYTGRVRSFFISFLVDWYFTKPPV